MKRREFIKYSTAGLAALAVGQHLLPGMFRGISAQAANIPVGLRILDAEKEMVDTRPLFHYAFADFTPPFNPANPDASTFGPRVPGPVINANAGDTITVTLVNNSTVPHAFAISGIGTVSPTVPAPSAGDPNPTATFSFPAPAPGSYFYYDPLRNVRDFLPELPVPQPSLNTLLGAYGALIVRPTVGNNPYGAGATANIQALFNHFGTTDHFPGRPWSPILGNADNREKIWLFSQVDSRLHDLFHDTPTPAAPAIAAALGAYLPDYFMINGRSGAFSSHDLENEPGFQDEIDRGYALNPHDFVGRPYVIRVMNVGWFNAHSPHLHGNHFYVLAVNGTPRNNLWLLDTFSLPGLAGVEDNTIGAGARFDFAVPLIVPPDIVGATPTTLLRVHIPEELAALTAALRNHRRELSYPMHTHEEQAQTAAGGNYPQGAVLHGITFIGDIDGVEF